MKNKQTKQINNNNIINLDAKEETNPLRKVQSLFYIVFAQVISFLWLEYSPYFYKAIQRI